MDINQLILLVKKKIKEKISLESINIEDKSFLHKNHASNQTGKFHLKLIIQSKENCSTTEEIIKNMKRGLFVTELIGHGVNLGSGDYSRGASG